MISWRFHERTELKPEMRRFFEYRNSWKTLTKLAARMTKSSGNSYIQQQGSSSIKISYGGKISTANTNWLYQITDVSA